MIRDDTWLLSRLDHIWTKHFFDVPQLNPVVIHFGRFARLRFGSIRMEDLSLRPTNQIIFGVRKRPQQKVTVITITAMFKDTEIPATVVDHTIAHELVHYAHGFSSPHPRMHRFPHEGGVVRREMEKRGLGSLVNAYKEWIKDYREELREYYRHRR